MTKKIEISTIVLIDRDSEDNIVMDVKKPFSLLYEDRVIFLETGKYNICLMTENH